MKITKANIFDVSRGLLSGLNKHPELPVTHVSSSTLTAARAAALNGQSGHVSAIQNTRLTNRNQSTVKQGAIHYASLCRDVLVPFLGRSWDSTTWPSAGWTKGTLSIPTSAPALVDLYMNLHKFLEAHSDHESDKHEVTAEKVQEQLDALEASVQAVLDAKSNQRKKSAARETSDEGLLSQVRSLVAELEIILKQDDVRWMDFLASVPGDERRPESVDVIVVLGGAVGELEVDWERTPRTDRYHVEVLIPGPDAAFKRFATVRDTNATLTDLPPGVPVKVRVVAVNDAGEAAPSEEVTAEVPALARAA